MTFRIIVDSPADPAENMRRDLALLERYAIDRVPTVRLYSWSERCFTYGRNQDREDAFDIRALVRDQVRVAQRPTGGQVLCHGNDVSYAVVASCADLGCGHSVKESYRKICGCVIAAYHELGLDASLACDAGLEPFEDDSFCLSGLEAYDIVVDEKKIGGNAQRRVRDAVLQHGSLPLSFDEDFVAEYVFDLDEEISERIAVISDFKPKVTAEEVIEALRRSFERYEI